MKKYLRYLPDDEESLRELAKGYLELKDQFRAWEKAEALLLISERRQESEEVLRWATFILQLDPQRSDIIHKQISALTDLGQLDEAADWLWRLADLHRQSGEKGAEQSACLKLLELSLDRFDLNRSAAERLFELGLERRARSELEQLAKQCLEQDKNSAAIEIYQGLCKRFPEETDYRIALAESLARADQCSLAVDQRLFLHDLYQKQNRPVEMVANLKSALGLAPEQAQLHELLGKVFSDLGNFREAIQYLMKAAQLATTEEDRLRAAQCYRAIFQIEPDHLESLRSFHLLQTGCALNDEEKEELRQVRQRLIGLLADQGSDALPEMDRLAETLEADYPEDEETLRILSNAYRRLRPPQAAALTLRLLEKEIHKKDWRAAESDLRLVQSLFPSSLPLSGSFELDSLKFLVSLCENTTLAEKVLPQQALLAEAYVDLQDREAAIRQYEILAQTAPDPMEYRQALIENLDIAGYYNRSREEKLTLAEFYRKQGRPSEAIASVQSALNYEKDNLECLQLLADLYLETNAIGQAGPVLKQMANITEEQGNFKEAENYLKNLIEQSPPDGKLFEDLARLQQIQGQVEAARETQLQAAQIYERSGQVEHAIELLNLMIAAFPEPSDRQVEIRHILIDLLRQKGLGKEALSPGTGYYRMVHPTGGLRPGS